MEMVAGAGAHRSRCHFRDDPAAVPPPPTDHPAPPIAASPGRPRLQMVALQKTFRPPLTLPFLRRATAVHAVDAVTLDIPPGETLAVVGESGSGKSTLARCVAGLLMPDEGAIRLEGAVIPGRVPDRSRAQQQAIQFIFQNPDAALNPHWTTEDIIGRPLDLYTPGLSAADRRRRVIEQMEAVQLGERYLGLYPRQMSGGEKQRICIARAFAASPRLVICDEPTSALDVSVQAAIVESGDPSAVFANPAHPYTRRLLAAVPTLNPPQRRSARQSGAVQAPVETSA
jgi:peptide/nickel transport system ATP-binding protein